MAGRARRELRDSRGHASAVPEPGQSRDPSENDGGRDLERYGRRGGYPRRRRRHGGRLRDCRGHQRAYNGFQAIAGASSPSFPACRDPKIRSRRPIHPRVLNRDHHDCKVSNEMPAPSPGAQGGGMLVAFLRRLVGRPEVAKRQENQGKLMVVILPDTGTVSFHLVLQGVTGTRMVNRAGTWRGGSATGNQAGTAGPLQVRRAGGASPVFLPGVCFGVAAGIRRPRNAGQEGIPPFWAACPSLTAVAQVPASATRRPDNGRGGRRWIAHG